MELGLRRVSRTLSVQFNKFVVRPWGGRRTSEEKDKERDSGYSCCVVGRNEKTEPSPKEGPCHIGKGEQEEVASSKRVDCLPSHK